MGAEMNAKMRQFETGATRNLDADKLDYEGFLSPLVLERFAIYMHRHRMQADGVLRDSDNWQKGIPQVAYMKSGFRHFFDWWKEHRGLPTDEGLEEALCALLFNVQGYLHEHLKAEQDRFVLTIDRELTKQAFGEPLTVHIEDDDDLGLKAGEAFREESQPGVVGN